MADFISTQIGWPIYSADPELNEIWGKITFFVYSGIKQDSAKSIALFSKDKGRWKQEIKLISDLTEG